MFTSRLALDMSTQKVGTTYTVKRERRRRTLERPGPGRSHKISLIRSSARAASPEVLYIARRPSWNLGATQPDPTRPPKAFILPFSKVINTGQNRDQICREH
jgi:hypothetical protein